MSSIRPENSRGVASLEHKIWTKRGERRFQVGQVPTISDSDNTSDDSKPVLLDRRNDPATTRDEEDRLLAGVGRFDKILNAVSSFWEGKELSEYLNPGGSSFDSTSIPGVFSKLKSGKEGQVGYLDKSLCEPKVVEKRVEYFPPASSSSVVAPNISDPPQQSKSPYSHIKLPPEVRMITYSDEIPKPDLPPPPGPMLPDIYGESPLTLLAASGPDVLENMDNTVLENIVPRDSQTGRPLTIGSMEHSEGTCRPCIFYLRAKCFKGLRCTFCHFNHTTLRKQVVISPPSVPIGSNDGAEESGVGVVRQQPTIKTKRLRPSKRTRELIKQINAQSATLSAAVENDPNGPPLSVQETTTTTTTTATPVPTTLVIPHHRQ